MVPGWGPDEVGDHRDDRRLNGLEAAGFGIGNLLADDCGMDRVSSGSAALGSFGLYGTMDYVLPMVH